MKRAGLLLALLLAACSGGTKQADKAQPPQDLEKAAIERGLIRNPADTDIAGLYARDTDRICIVPDEQLGYRIGAFVDYGDRITCSGSGRASRVGGRSMSSWARTAAARSTRNMMATRSPFPARCPMAATDTAPSGPPMPAWKSSG